MSQSIGTAVLLAVIAMACTFVIWMGARLFLAAVGNDPLLLILLFSVGLVVGVAAFVYDRLTERDSE